MAYDDFEQSERVREWIRNNGLSVVLGIVVGLALVFGYRLWNQHRANVKVEAATQFALVDQALRSGNDTQADTLLESLQKHHGKSAYAVLATTLDARRQLAAGKGEAAIAALRWAVEHAPDAPLKQLSQLRLARAYLATNAPQQALDTLELLPKDAFPALAAELKGDALVRLKHPSEAQQAYQAAVQAYPENAPQRQILQMKIDSLPATPAATADDNVAAAPVSPITRDFS